MDRSIFLIPLLLFVLSFVCQYSSAVVHYLILNVCTVNWKYKWGSTTRKKQIQSGQCLVPFALTILEGFSKFKYVFLKHHCFVCTPFFKLLMCYLLDNDISIHCTIQRAKVEIKPMTCSNNKYITYIWLFINVFSFFFC